MILVGFQQSTGISLKSYLKFQFLKFYIGYLFYSERLFGRIFILEIIYII